MTAPRTAQISARITIVAPPETVFAAATNWPVQHEWMVGTRVKATHLEGHDLSGRIEAFTGFGKLGITDTMTITAWEPPHRCSVLHTGRWVRGTGIFEVIDLADGTSQFVWGEDLLLPFGIVGKIGWPLVKPVAAYGLRLSLKRFGRWVESKPTTA